MSARRARRRRDEHQARRARRRRGRRPRDRADASEDGARGGPRPPRRACARTPARLPRSASPSRGSSTPRGAESCSRTSQGDWAGRPIREPLSRALDRPVAARQRRPCLRARRGACRCGARRRRRDVHRLRHRDRRRARPGRAASPRHRRPSRRDRPPHGRARRAASATAATRAVSSCSPARGRSHAAAGRGTFDEALVAARDGDDAAAVDAIERAGELIGVAIANLTIFVTPQRVVIGGGVAEAGDLLLGPLCAEIQRRAGNVAPLEHIEILRATLGPDAGAIGAALFAADAAAGTIPA